jgi:hypothetical protein
LLDRVIPSCQPEFNGKVVPRKQDGGTVFDDDDDENNNNNNNIIRVFYLYITTF